MGDEVDELEKSYANSQEKEKSAPTVSEPKEAAATAKPKKGSRMRTFLMAAMACVVISGSGVIVVLILMRSWGII